MNQIESNEKIENYTMHYGDNTFISQGWQCPKCGNIMSPFTPYCLFCSKSESYITTSEIKIGGTDE